MVSRLQEGMTRLILLAAIWRYILKRALEHTNRRSGRKMS